MQSLPTDGQPLHTVLFVAPLLPPAPVQELRPLAALPRLVDLCFSDPMWGDCPLAQLCNYQTFVLFMLPRWGAAIEGQDVMDI